MKLINEILPVLVQIGVVLLTIFGGYIGKKINIYLNTKIKKDVVKETVNYVEQVASILDINGEEKYDLALDKATELFNIIGISITASEIDVLIESFVKGLTSSVEVEE